MLICDYGCNSEALYRLKNGKNCCSKVVSSCEAMKKINSNGLKKAYKEGNHSCIFNDEHRKKSTETRLKKAKEKLLSGEYTGSNHYVKKILTDLLKVESKCQKCGINEWFTQPIPLELDHIDGNSRNNDPDNLRLLCPNCHSLTPTWRGRNINNGKAKVSDEKILTELKKCNNIRQVLIAVGLAPKGGNYSRVKKLLEKMKE